MSQPARVLLTPTARLARGLARDLAADMTAEGKLAWLPPAIFSFPAWLGQLRDNYFVACEDDRVPINAQQALVLWQSLIDREVFIGEPQVADLAQRSWNLIHEHNLAAPSEWQPLLLSEDSRRFKSWAAAYIAECAKRGFVDEWAFAAETPHLVTEGRIAAPDEIELIGFELPMTPLQGKVLSAFEAAGTKLLRPAPPQDASEPPELLQFNEPDEELVGAALWARTLVEATPDLTIAVVVPDLNGRVDRIDRLFRQVFDPSGFALQESGPEPWHISLGKPLADWSLITDALAILALASNQLNQPQAARLLRSPFLDGWQSEAAARSHALAMLARTAPYDITGNELIWLLERSAAATLAERLAAWQKQRREATSSAWPSEWAGNFQEELSCLGFGSGRTLNSREYQILQRWHDLLETFSTLDVVFNRPVSRDEAVELLSQRARSAVFRERNPGVPVEILGVQEALGSKFDALWITTLDHNTWPGPSGRDPLIPSAVQSSVPRATSDGCLEHARLELAGLLASAPVTQGSFARGSEEIPIEVTALLTDCLVRLAEPIPPLPPADMATPYPDDQAPAFEGVSAKGGTGVLRDQSSCPFRAFAERRLNAIDLTPPRPGLDAGQRGTVIHKALEHFWRDLDGSADLVALLPKDAERRIQIAVEVALDEFTERFRLTLTKAGRLLEQRRTERVVSRWLDIERQRAEFSVIEQEGDVTLNLERLTLTGKIDRVDRLADGTTLLIDYKTGRASKSSWFPERRIADPQLPAYAVSMDPKPGAIAFARIRPEDLKFEGIADGDVGTPGIRALADEQYSFKELDSWSGLLEDWQTHLEGLARDFKAGKAAVDPRKPAVCNTCHLHALCRILERAPYDSMSQENGDE